jgi:hypothetical protein
MPTKPEPLAVAHRPFRLKRKFDGKGKQMATNRNAGLQPRSLESSILAFNH